LRRGRPLTQGLLGAFQRGRFHVGAEVLRHALPDQKQRANNRDR
jgi:hypothetical protein